MTESIEGRESLPTESQIRLQVEKIVAGRDYEEVRRVEDELGPLFVEWKSTDDVGDQMDVFYKRKGNDGKNNIAPVTTIEVMYYFNDMPCNGETKADFIDGKWDEK
jgi:hypothetical protein